MVTHGPGTGMARTVSMPDTRAMGIGNPASVRPQPSAVRLRTLPRVAGAQLPHVAGYMYDALLTGTEDGHAAPLSFCYISLISARDQPV